jgi:hypothetical protein
MGETQKSLSLCEEHRIKLDGLMKKYIFLCYDPPPS